MGFGKILEKKMKEKYVKQAELANAVGIPKTTLCSIITRDTNKVDIDQFLRICKYLNCAPEEFYAQYEDENKEAPQPIDNKWEALRSQLIKLSDDELTELHNYVKFINWKQRSEKKKD